MCCASKFANVFNDNVNEVNPIHNLIQTNRIKTIITICSHNFVHGRALLLTVQTSKKLQN